MRSDLPSTSESESEFERLFDLSLDLFCIASFDGYFKRVNPAFERALGYSSQELLSRPFLELVHPDDLQRSRDVLAAAFRGNDVIGFENRVICADGSVRWLEWNTRTVPGEEFVYGVARDVTDRLRAEAELREAHHLVETSRDELRVLADEQAALRQVAVLVAQQPSPNEVFTAVTQAVGVLLDADIALLLVFSGDGMATSIGTWSCDGGPSPPVGTRFPLDDDSLSARIIETGAPARIERYAEAEGEVADSARSLGVRSSVGAPILVEGKLWGVLAAGSRGVKPWAENAEHRIAAFTELVATAIANAESREARAVLTEEQAALGRVATLVAAGAAPEQVFMAVVEEASSLVGLELIELVRYDGENTVTVIAVSGEHPFPAGMTWSLDDPSLLGTVARTKRSARIDDYGSLDSATARLAGSSGFHSAIGAPITVEGRLWGMLGAGSTDPEPIPERVEARLVQFTELVATAVANAEARHALERVAAEQAALRRVATLVAHGARPTDLFAAVAEEVGRLHGVDHAYVTRFDSDDTVTAMARWSSTGEPPPVALPRRCAAGPMSAAIRDSRGPVRIDPYSDPAAGEFESGLRSLVAAPITVEGERWGMIGVSSTNAERPPAPGTEERLTKFTDLIATAIANAENRSELTASRKRLVAASDNARRRIERDLHDGVQQELVSLSLELSRMKTAPADEDTLKTQLASMSDDVDSVLDSLVEIARGIHPAILSQGGLETALTSLGRRSPLSVEVDARIDRSLPDAVEVAAYYVVSEALTNVAKHAAASVVQIDATTNDGTLTLVVRDDGVGGAVLGEGSGLVGLQDRVEALGGTITIDSSAARGTSVVVTLPVATEPDQEIEKMHHQASG